MIFTFIIGFILGCLISYYIYKEYKPKCLGFKIGDQVYYHQELYELVGFSKESCVIRNKNNNTDQIVDIDSIVNASKRWRDMYHLSSIYCDPLFRKDYHEPNKDQAHKTTFGEYWNGKNINTLSETECKIAYEELIKEENFELAEKILNILNTKYR
jgi:hypothetical protein